MLHASDPLRCSFESPYELRVTHHCASEDSERHLPPDRRLIGAMHLAELADSDQLSELVAGDRPLDAARHRRWEPIDAQLGEVGTEVATDEVVDVRARVTPDELES